MDKRINCEELTDLIDPYVDAELSAQDRDAFERHVGACAGCAGAVAEARAASAAVRRLGRHPAPPGLADRVRASLDANTEPPPPPPIRPVSRRLLVVSHLGAAAAGVVAAVLWTILPPKPDPIGDIVAGHVRVMFNEEFRGVESASPHTVRPWFAGKVEFAPRVPDVSAAGYPLLGGRVDALQRRTVAVLMYGRREHRITLFVQPNETRSPRVPVAGGERGYHAVGWADTEFSYWAVSDLNPRELQEFAELVRSAVAASGGSPPTRAP